MTKRTDSSKKKRYQIELSAASVFFWGVCFVFFMGWIFVLGILVGRGFLPGANTAIADLKAQVAKLQDMVVWNKRADRKSQPREDIDSKLGFYDQLESKKEEKRKPFSDTPPEAPKREKAAKPAGTALAEVKADIARNEALPKKQDLSKNTGTEKKPKETAPTSVTQTGKTQGPFRYAIQIAALDERSKAEDMVRRLSERGVDAYFQQTVVKGRTYYRVRCGKFATREEADQYSLKLPKEAGTKWRVVHVE